MKLLRILLVNDFKKIFRDSTMTMIFVVPFLLILILRFVFPFIIQNYIPQGEAYLRYMALLFSVLASFFPAFIISFIILDEKDENLFDVFKVLPFSPMQFFLYRLGFIMVFGMFFAFITMIFSNAFSDSWILLALYALSFSMFSSIIALFIINYAKNKIEGVTYFKVLNTLLILPMIAFFISSKWTYILGIIPLYWTYQANEVLHGKGVFLLISFAYNAGLLFLMYGIFRKKVFR